MFALLFLVFGLALIVGIALLIIGIVLLCKKNGANGETAPKTGGILFTVFGAIILFISLIIIMTSGIAAAIFG